MGTPVSSIDATNIEPFPFFRLEGSSHEVGHQHGQLLGDRIAVSIDHYAERFETTAGISWQDVLQMSEAIANRLRVESPELVEEMEGIAIGSDVPFAAIVALNARTMMLRTALNRDRSDSAECTTGALLPRATADGHTYLFGNWDQNYRCVENSALLEIRVIGRPAIFTLTEAGILIRTGFNEHGIGITGNSLISDRDTGDSRGTPWPIIRRRVLWHDRIAPAAREVFQASRSHSGNHVIADAEGFAVDLEATPETVFTLGPDQGVVAHANHFLSVGAQARVIDIQLGRSPSSLYRHARVQEAMEATNGSATIADIQAALTDHFGHPQSVCTHPGQTNSLTVSSHIADLTTRTMTISSGPPCENAYRTFHLSSA